MTALERAKQRLREATENAPVPVVTPPAEIEPKEKSR